MRIEILILPTLFTHGQINKKQRFTGGRSMRFLYRSVTLLLSWRHQSGTIDVNFKDNGTPFHCVSKEVQSLDLMEMSNKHWKVTINAKTKHLSWVFGAYRKFRPIKWYWLCVSECLPKLLATVAGSPKKTYCIRIAHESLGHSAHSLEFIDIKRAGA